MIQSKLRPSAQARRMLVALGAGVALPLALVVACADGRERVPPLGGGLAGAPTSPDPCAAPNQGCACEEDGLELDCGRLTETFGDYVTCQMGTRTCVDGEWSACVGDRVTVKALPGAGSLRPRTPGVPEECDDACDPYCVVTPETPDLVDAGPGFTNDGGLTLTETGIVGCSSLTLAPTPSTVAAGSTVTVTDFDSPPVTSPAGPVTFTLTADPPGCAESPFAAAWTSNRPSRALTTGTDDTDGELTVAVPIAGPIQVTAYALGLSASTTINVKVNVLEAPIAASEAEPNEPATATQINAFGPWNSPNAGSTAAGVVWLYPYQNTYFPLGLPAPVVQYWYTSTGGGGTTAAVSSSNRAVKVSLRYPVNTSSNPAAANYSDFNYSLIVRESNTVSQSAGLSEDSRDPQVTIPEIAWRYFEQTARGNDADLVVQRRRSTTVENESRRVIRLVDGQLKGSVYYNSYTSPLAGNTGAVLRIAPGATAPTVAVQPTSNGTATGTRRCLVCHSLNLEGTQLIANGQRQTGGVTFNNSQRFNTSNTANPPYAVPVQSSYDAASGIDTENVPGNRYTFGGPRTDGSLYMTHSGFSSGDPNWRSPPAYSNLYSPTDPNNIVALSGWPSNMRAITPRFSPAGNRLAFGFWAGNSLSASPSGTLAAVSGGTRLAVVDFACNSPPCNGGGEGVSNARDLTPGVTQRVAWPSFTPDGSAVIYQRQYRTSQSLASGGVLTSGWSPSHMNTVAGALAELWMSVVPTNGSTAAVPTLLRALNGYNPTGTGSYLPEDNRTVSAIPRPADQPTSWAGFHRNAGTSFTITQADWCGNTGTATGVKDVQLNYLPAVSPVQAGGYTWVVFTSRRMYGNVTNDDPWSAEPVDWAGMSHSCYSGIPPTKKLWIAAIDPTITPGQDPSHPAFYLPGQELAAGNSDGYWVSAPCVTAGNTCVTNDDCCGGTGSSPTTACRVVSAATFPPTQECQNISTCAAEGLPCTTTSDCCSGLVCPSGGGACVNVPATEFVAASLTREFVADCPHGTQVAWRAFEWQATIPADTSIAFSVQSKLEATDSYQPTTPLPLSTADSTNTLNPTTWYRGSQTVDQVLAASATPVASGPYLLVTMDFNPTSSAPPTLHQWRQIYDCLPAE